MRILKTALALIACAFLLAATGSLASPNQTAETKIKIEGMLTNEGVECQALRADDGKLYTLVGKLREFKVGDRVRIVGTIVEVSICQQGTTIKVKKIKRSR